MRKDNPLIIFSLEHTEKPNTIRMTAAAANLYVLDFEMLPNGAQDYDQMISDLCELGQAMMKADADLAEAYDDAGRTKPRYRNLHIIQTMRNRYAGRITDIEGSLEAFG